MAWIDSRLQERQELTERMFRLKKDAWAIWNDLHRVCCESVTAYNKQVRFEEIKPGPKLSDSFSFSRMEYIAHGVGEPKAVVRVRFDRERLAIFVEHGGASVIPTFTIGEDGAQSALKHESRTIEIADAAERILDPLLFWDLPQMYAVTGKA